MSGPATITLLSSDNVEISVGMSLIAQPLLQRALSLPLRSPVFGIHADFTTPTEREVAERSVLIKNMLEDVGHEATTEAIPIPNVGHLEATWGWISAKL